MEICTKCYAQKGRVEKPATSFVFSSTSEKISLCARCSQEVRELIYEKPKTKKRATRK